MTTVGITGASGLLGWHLRTRLSTDETLKVVVTDRNTFLNAGALRGFAAGCDAVFHFAGMNRGEESEIERVNRVLAEKLVESLDDSGARPHVVFASSTHVEKDTAYGRSKRVATELLREWAGRTGARFTDLILPHVFGEGGRPFYNSVVSTFCHQLAMGETPRIDVDGDLELLHAQEVAELCIDAIRKPIDGTVRPNGRPMRVSELLELLDQLARSYLSSVVPAFRNMFDLRLFNTFRSYLYPDHYPWSLTLHRDPRGSLFEAVKTNHGGQAFLSTTRPGITRGDHFHLNKFERFLVVHGEAVIRLRRVFDDRVVEFRVTGAQPSFVDMPTLHAHNITNVGDEDLVTLFWSHEIFDRASPDTYSERVVPGGNR